MAKTPYARGSIGEDIFKVYGDIMGWDVRTPKEWKGENPEYKTRFGTIAVYPDLKVRRWRDGELAICHVDTKVVLLKNEHLPNYYIWQHTIDKLLQHVRHIGFNASMIYLVWIHEKMVELMPGVFVPPMRYMSLAMLDGGNNGWTKPCRKYDGGRLLPRKHCREFVWPKDRAPDYRRHIEDLRLRFERERQEDNYLKPDQLALVS